MRKRLDISFKKYIITVTIIIIEWMVPMALIKRSRQREAILSELCGRTDHPTAEELYLSLKEELPNLSLGTDRKSTRLNSSH